MHKLARSVSLSLLFFTSFSASAGVIVGDKEWFQPSLFTGLSWDDIATVCSSSSGSCAGTLGATAVDGATWATVAEVNALFNTFLPASLALGPGPSFVSLPALPAAPAFFAAFTPILSLPLSDRLGGHTRNLSLPCPGRCALYGSVIDAFDPSSLDFFGTVETRPSIIRLGDVGAFIYTSALVPEPSILALLSLGLAGLGLTRYRRQKQASL